MNQLLYRYMKQEWGQVYIHLKLEENVKMAGSVPRVKAMTCHIDEKWT